MTDFPYTCRSRRTWRVYGKFTLKNSPHKGKRIPNVCQEIILLITDRTHVSFAWESSILTETSVLRIRSMSLLKLYKIPYLFLKILQVVDCVDFMCYTVHDVLWNYLSQCCYPTIKLHISYLVPRSPIYQSIFFTGNDILVWQFKLVRTNSQLY